VTAIYATAAGGRAVEQRYREILRLWPVPSEWLFITTREGDTFVVACGPPDAPPLHHHAAGRWRRATCGHAGTACSTRSAPAGGWNGPYRTRPSGCCLTLAMSYLDSPAWSSTSSDSEDHADTGWGYKANTTSATSRTDSSTR
jgi:hypothetical protein